MATKQWTVQLSSTFDYSKVIEGINKAKAHLSSVHIGDEIAKDLKKSLEKIELDIPALEKLNGKTELSQKEAEKYLKILEKVSTEIKAFNQQVENTDFSKTFSKIDTSKIDELDKKIKEVEVRLKDARKDLGKEFLQDKFQGNKTSKTIKDAIKQLFEVEPEEIDEKFKEIESTISKQYDESIKRTGEILSTKTSKELGSGIKILEAFYGKNSGVEFQNKMTSPFLEQFRKLREEFKSAPADSEKAQEAIQKILNLLQDPTFIKKSDKATPFNLPTAENIDQLEQVRLKIGDIKNYLDEKKDIFTPEQAEIINLIEQKVNATEEALKGMGIAQEGVKEAIEHTGKPIISYNKELEEALDLSKRNEAQNKALESTFGSLARRIQNSISALTVFNKSIQIVRQAVNSVKELDAAFTQIAIVSEQSNEQAWSMFDSFNKLAKQYSITTKDLTEGAKLFYQQGLNAADTMKMVEASTVSAALGEVTMTEAANTLTAAIQGYNESAAVAMDYTDKIAMVGAVSAADFNELSTAMEKTASSAYTAGIDFDHLLGK